MPANARVARFFPARAALALVHVVMSNAGYNGAKAALAHGVPLVLAPWVHDQPDVARGTMTRMQVEPSADSR
jgi:UDP:flavonoid glycosyltransferase YjiC (YdhE family)